MTLEPGLPTKPVKPFGAIRGCDQWIVGLHTDKWDCANVPVTQNGGQQHASGGGMCRSVGKICGLARIRVEVEERLVDESVAMLARSALWTKGGRVRVLLGAPWV